MIRRNFPYPKGIMACFCCSVMLHLAGLALVVAGIRAGQDRSSLAYLDFALTPPEMPDRQTVPPPSANREAAPPEPQQATESPPAEETPPRTALPEPAQEKIATSRLGLGMMYGYVNSLAEGATLRDDVRDYYFRMVERINDAWWKLAEQGAGEPMAHDGFVEVVLARDGALLECRVRGSSGSRTVDRLFVQAVRNAAPLPPLPEHFPYDIFSAPLRIVRPSNLFRATANR